MKNKKNQTSIKSPLSHAMVHYLLTIHKLKESRGYARVTDIARELSLTKGSVSTALNNLKAKNLIQEEEGSKFVILSSLGHEKVHKILTSRSLLFHFLKDFIGVSQKIAIRDACLMAHLISEETRVKFFDFIKKSTCQECSDGNPCQGLKSKTSLDLCDFDSVFDFIEEQKDEGYNVKNKGNS